MICCQLETSEVFRALELVWQVFLQYDAYEYIKEGIDVNVMLIR